MPQEQPKKIAKRQKKKRIIKEERRQKEGEKEENNRDAEDKLKVRRQRADKKERSLQYIFFVEEKQ